MRSRPAFSERTKVAKNGAFGTNFWGAGGPQMGEVIFADERLRCGETNFLRLSNGKGWVFDMKNGRRILEPLIQRDPEKLHTVTGEVHLCSRPDSSRSAKTSSLLLPGQRVVSEYAVQVQAEAVQGVAYSIPWVFVMRPHSEMRGWVPEFAIRPPLEEAENDSEKNMVVDIKVVPSPLGPCPVLRGEDDDKAASTSLLRRTGNDVPHPISQNNHFGEDISTPSTTTSSLTHQQRSSLRDVATPQGGRVPSLEEDDMGPSSELTTVGPALAKARLPWPGAAEEDRRPATPDQGGSLAMRSLPPRPMLAF